MNKYKINQKVNTPDGLGIVKIIKELCYNKIGYACLLEKPYKVIDPYTGERDYDYPAWSFGQTYPEDELSEIA